MTTNSHFVPTPGIENLPNTLILQRLIQERIRSTLLNENMVDTSLPLAVQFLEVPPRLQSEAEIHAYLKEEAAKIVEVFKKFEAETPSYAESINMLKAHEGRAFKIFSITFPGIHILLEDM